MDLTEIIRQFAADHPEWTTYKGAKNECSFASEEFICRLRLHGIHTATEFWFDINNPDNPNPGVYKKPGCDGHVVVQIGELLYDWTARQYCAIAPFPYILPAKTSIANHL